MDNALEIAPDVAFERDVVMRIELQLPYLVVGKVPVRAKRVREIDALGSRQLEIRAAAGARYGGADEQGDNGTAGNKSVHARKILTSVEGPNWLKVQSPPQADHYCTGYDT
ncbi:MAG: hypothetical protein JO133_08825 [Burkholderiaceae bacterium]|nr:hypothetical protein [Burkholderiaceae bacterium]